MNEEIKYFTIDVAAFSPDFKILRSIICPELDHRQESFTKSKFDSVPHPLQKTLGRFNMRFHPEEMQILIRRLLEVQTLEAHDMVLEIIDTYYGVEI